MGLLKYSLSQMIRHFISPQSKMTNCSQTTYCCQSKRLSIGLSRHLNVSKTYPKKLTETLLQGNKTNLTKYLFDYDFYGFKSMWNSFFLSDRGVAIANF